VPGLGPGSAARWQTTFSAGTEEAAKGRSDAPSIAAPRTHTGMMAHA
jgi:hypothetical protein